MWLGIGCYPSEVGGKMPPLRSGIWSKHLKTILYIWPSLSRGHQIVTIMIHYCYYLNASGKWSLDTWYRKKNIASFIFASTSVSALGIVLSWNCMHRLVYLLKLLTFEKDSYFSPCNVYVQLCLRRVFKNLCPNVQKPPLSSPIPAFACAGMAPL